MRAEATSIDFNPAECPNVESVGDAPWTFEVALFSTPTFDATLVDINRIQLRTESGMTLPGGVSGVDVGRAAASSSCDCVATAPDGLIDALLDFDVDLLNRRILSAQRDGPVVLTLSGYLLDGTFFSANDCVVFDGHVPVDAIVQGAIGVGG